MPTPVPGKTIRLNTIPAGREGDGDTAVTDVNGEVQFNVTSATAEVVRYTVTDITDSIESQGVPLEFTWGPYVSPAPFDIVFDFKTPTLGFSVRPAPFDIVFDFKTPTDEDQGATGYLLELEAGGAAGFINSESDVTVTIDGTVVWTKNQTTTSPIFRGIYDTPTQPVGTDFSYWADSVLNDAALTSGSHSFILDVTASPPGTTASVALFVTKAVFDGGSGTWQFDSSPYSLILRLLSDGTYEYSENGGSSVPTTSPYSGNYTIP